MVTPKAKVAPHPLGGYVPTSESSLPIRGHPIHPRSNLPSPSGALHGSREVVDPAEMERTGEALEVLMAAGHQFIGRLGVLGIHPENDNVGKLAAASYGAPGTVAKPPIIRRFSYSTPRPPTCGCLHEETKPVSQIQEIDRGPRRSTRNGTDLGEFSRVGPCRLRSVMGSDI